MPEINVLICFGGCKNKQQGLFPGKNGAWQVDSVGQKGASVCSGILGWQPGEEEGIDEMC